MNISDLRSTVASTISASTPDVVQNVIDLFVKTEKDRRTTLLIDGLKRHAEAEAALAKIKPDQVFFDDEGKMIGQPAWTAKQKGERDKARKILNRLTEVLNNAINNGDVAEFKSLEDLLKGGGNKETDAS